MSEGLALLFTKNQSAKARNQNSHIDVLAVSKDTYKHQTVASSITNGAPAFSVTEPKAAFFVDVALGAADVVVEGVELSLTPDGELLRSSGSGLIASPLITAPLLC